MLAYFDAEELFKGERRFRFVRELQKLEGVKANTPADDSQLYRL